jgi:hypothetical protein
VAAARAVADLVAATRTANPHRPWNSAAVAAGGALEPLLALFRQAQDDGVLHGPAALPLRAAGSRERGWAAR